MCVVGGGGVVWSGFVVWERNRAISFLLPVIHVSSVKKTMGNEWK